MSHLSKVKRQRRLKDTRPSKQQRRIIRNRGLAKAEDLARENVTRQIQNGELKRPARVVVETQATLSNKDGSEAAIVFDTTEVPSAEITEQEDGSTSCQMGARVILTDKTALYDESGVEVTTEVLSIPALLDLDANVPWRIVLSLQVKYVEPEDGEGFFEEKSLVINNVYFGDEMRAEISDIGLQRLMDNITAEVTSVVVKDIEVPIRAVTLKDHVEDELEEWQINPFTDITMLPSLEGQIPVVASTKAESNAWKPDHDYIPSDIISVHMVAHVCTVRHNLTEANPEHWTPYTPEKWIKARSDAGRDAMKVIAAT